jgi:hypothetical protein
MDLTLIGLLSFAFGVLAGWALRGWVDHEVTRWECKE